MRLPERSVGRIFCLMLCNEFMKPGMSVRLIKEPDNQFDKEAIRIEMKGLGKVGYVANSPHTVRGESMSAGRLYDRIGNKAKAKILYVLSDSAFCCLKKESIKYKPKKR